MALPLFELFLCRRKPFQRGSATLQWTHFNLPVAGKENQS